MEDSFVTVRINQGQLRGKVQQSVFSNRLFYIFKGIPYAKPPVGKLRFKAPQPPDGWAGVRDALQDGSDCKQELPPWAHKPELGPSQLFHGDEDCLYLNVSSNKLPCVEEPSLSRPVMVHIHGGGYTGGSGSSALMGPDFFMEQPVVLVTINYRCGAFGFLSVETDEAPGNAGLKDQVLALQWVRDNIRSFGGDPGNVTVFGISAGAASVQYLLASPLSRGLFHKAIMESGSCLNPWALQRQPRTKALGLARILGCDSQDLHEILAFLQDVSADDLLRAQKTLSEQKDAAHILDLSFTPCVEPPGDDAFLPDLPETLFRSGNFQSVPVILGSVSNEGSVMIYASQLNDALMQNYNKNPSKFVGSPLGLELDPETREEVGEKISEFYMSGKPASWETLGAFLNLLGDMAINIGVEESRRLLLSKSSEPVFSYVFDYHKRCFCSALGALKPELQALTSRLKGVCHAGEALTLFAPHQYLGLLSAPKTTEEDRKAITSLVTAWTTFAKNGNPNNGPRCEGWKEDSENNRSFMEIGETWSAREGVAFGDRMSFWDRIKSITNKENSLKN